MFYWIFSLLSWADEPLVFHDQVVWHLDTVKEGPPVLQLNVISHLPLVADPLLLQVDDVYGVLVILPCNKSTQVKKVMT